MSFEYTDSASSQRLENVTLTDDLKQLFNRNFVCIYINWWFKAIIQ